METGKSEPKIETIVLTLDGELMEGGSIKYKTLIEILEGSVGAIESIARVANYKNPVAFNLQPPQEKCFEISLQVVDWMGGVVTLLPNAPSIKDVIAFWIEYLKIKKAMRGEPVKAENIQTVNNGDTIIKNNSGDTVYIDQRKIVNNTFLLNVQSDPQTNKKIDKIAKAIEENKQMDTFSLAAFGEEFQIPKSDAAYYRYHEIMDQKPDSVVGYIRKIDNKTHKGVIVTQEGDKDRAVEFELGIPTEISKLEKIVSDLARAEADKSRVVFRGERLQDTKGKLKKIIVNDVDIPDTKFGF